MADEALKEAGSSTPAAGDSPDSTIEINIKTLDSQVYKLRVKKDMPVPVLKEKIVEVTGVPVDQQRLIFRGKVLKDDHLLSEYHLEDGYTLHLVARRPVEGQHTSGTASGENTQNDGSASASNGRQNRPGQASDGVVVGTVNLSGNGEGMLADVSRDIVEALRSEGVIDDMARGVGDILRSLGLGTLAPSTGVTNMSSASVRPNVAPEGANNFGGRTQPGNPAQPGFAILNHHIQVSQPPPTGLMPRNMVIPDSLTTLLEFIDRMDQVLQNNGSPSSAHVNAQHQARSNDISSNIRVPTPEVLGSVIERARQLLGGSAASALSHIAQRLEREAASTDAHVRSQIQSEAIQLGVAMQHFGAMLLELGRTMMMLRMGQSPAESFVNAGSAVYINSMGPNPIMVQPSLQTSPLFGVSSVPIVTGVSGPFGVVDPSRPFGGDPSRNINIQVHGVSAPSGPSTGTASILGSSVSGDPQSVERTTQDASNSVNSASTRGLPTRTVVAAIPARSPVEVPSHVLSVILPVQVRTQVTTPGQSTTSQGSNTTVSIGSQPNAPVLVPQTSGAGRIPAIVAQITSRVANAFAGNASGQVLSSNTQNLANHGSNPPTNNGLQSSTTAPAPEISSGAGTVTSPAPATPQMQNELSSTNTTSAAEISHVVAAGMLSSSRTDPDLSSQDGSSMNLSNVDSVRSHAHSVDMHEGYEKQQHSQASGYTERMDIEEPATASSIEHPTTSHTSDVPSSLSVDTSVEKNERSDRTTVQPGQHGASDRPAPLGLGLGGLQPKRRSRAAKPSGSSGESPDSTSVNQKQQAVARGQQVLQSLVSQTTDANRSNTHGSAPPARQLVDGMPLGRQGADGQIDVGNMISQVLNTPIFNNLLTNVAAQTGVSSPVDLRNMMEQCTQSPGIRDTLNDIVQNVDGHDLGSMFGSGREQGGIDFSRMMQQMMPVVSQVLGGGPGRPVATNGGQSGHQCQHNDSRTTLANMSESRNTQIDLRQACESIEQHDSPENIFHAVLESAGQLYGTDDGIQDLLGELSSDTELANGYMKFLLQQVRQRIQ